MKSWKYVSAVMALGLSTNLSAALLGINDTQMAFLGATEDGFNITLDNATGLEWLDWSLTTNRSYNDVYSQTQGGSLAGWRYATASEFESLAIAAGMPTTFFDARPGGTHAAFEVLNTFLGSSIVDNQSLAISGLRLSSTTHAVGGFHNSQDVFDIPDNTYATSEFNNVYSDDSFFIDLGSALVRDVSAVPIPAAGWLFGSGLIGLVGLARRKKA